MLVSRGCGRLPLVRTRVSALFYRRRFFGEFDAVVSSGAAGRDRLVLPAFHPAEGISLAPGGTPATGSGRSGRAKRF